MCWGVNVVAARGCRQGAFVSVKIYNKNDVTIDTGIAELASLAPRQIGFLHGDTFEASATNFRITDIDCFDY